MSICPTPNGNVSSDAAETPLWKTSQKRMTRDRVNTSSSSANEQSCQAFGSWYGQSGAIRNRYWAIRVPGERWRFGVRLPSAAFRSHGLANRFRARREPKPGFARGWNVSCWLQLYDE